MIDSDFDVLFALSFFVEKKSGNLEMVKFLLQNGATIRNFGKIFANACQVCVLIDVFGFCSIFFLRKCCRVAISRLSSYLLRWAPILMMVHSAIP